jgi:hypothetical protein
MKEPLKALDMIEEIERKTDRILGDASDAEIKNFVDLLENFKDADSENTYYRVLAAQRRAFTKTLAFENAFRAFAGLPGVSEAEPEEGVAKPFHYERKIQ